MHSSRAAFRAHRTRQPNVRVPRSSRTVRILAVIPPTPPSALPMVSACSRPATTATGASANLVSPRCRPTQTTSSVWTNATTSARTMVSVRSRRSVANRTVSALAVTRDFSATHSPISPTLSVVAQVYILQMYINNCNQQL